MILESFISLSLTRVLVNYSVLLSPKLRTFQSEFSYIEVWLTDQDSNPLDIEDKVNITMIIREV